MSPLNSAPAILTTNASQIQQYVFNRLIGTNGSIYREGAFVTFLQKGFSPYDGTLSTAPVSLVGISSFISNAKVKDQFSDPAQDAETVLNQPQLTVFFNPSNLDKSNFGVNTFNMAIVFHEGLHGFTGMTDGQLQSALGCTVQIASINITDYLEQFVFTTPPTTPTLCQ
jgi:hypothetical protein